MTLWTFTIPYRETMRYTCELGSFDFEMPWGGAIPELFISGNTFRKPDGTSITVSDEAVALLEARLSEHSKTRKDPIKICRTRSGDDHLPAHYRTLK